MSLMDARPPVDTAITSEGWDHGGVKRYSHTGFESRMARWLGGSGGGKNVVCEGHSV